MAWPASRPDAGGMKHRILVIVLAIAITAIAWQFLLRSVMLWLLIGFLAVLAFRYGPWRRRRSD
jgi:hypothetical protein